LKKCQKQAPSYIHLDSVMSEAVESFNRLGFHAFRSNLTSELAQSILLKIRHQELTGLKVWDDDGRYQLGDPFIKFDELKLLFDTCLRGFLEGIYGCGFSIYYSVIYKSTRVDNCPPQGSQLWHADGGPGTCINLMYCLSETTKQNGAMKCLPWQDTLKIFSQEDIERSRLTKMNKKNLSRMELRELTTRYYQKRIEEEFFDRVIQPTDGPGLIYAFRNNCLHSGGYTEIGHERYVCVFHIYPSMIKSSLDWCVKNGTKKVGAYPLSPDEIDLKIGDQRT